MVDSPTRPSPTRTATSASPTTGSRKTTLPDGGSPRYLAFIEDQSGNSEVLHRAASPESPELEAQQFPGVTGSGAFGWPESGSGAGILG